MSPCRALVLALSFAAAPAVASASTAADLCSLVADPCLVSTTVAVAPGSLLDFGARELHLLPTAKITFGAGTVTINAGRFTMTPGAQMIGTDPTAGGNLLVRTTGLIDIQGVGTKQATIDVSSGSNAGLIDLASSAGAINVDGELFAIGNGIFANGGTLNLHAAGNVAIGAGQLSVISGTQGFGGDIGVFADTGSIDAHQIIDASGGDGGGGTIDIEAGGDVITRAKLDVGGGGFSGDGGSVTLAAGGSVQMLGPEYGPSVGDEVNGGGDGADLSVYATTGQVLLSGLITNTGGSPDGGGGSVSVQAGTDIIQSDPFQLNGPGIDGCGGDTDLTAGGNITLDQMDVSGGSCGAGSVTIAAGGTVTAGAQVVGDSPDTGLGAAITVDAAAIDVIGQLRATGPLSAIDLRSCRIGLGSNAIIKALGLNSFIQLQAGGQIALAGTVQAGATGVNRFEYLDPTKPPTFKPNLVSPAPLLVLNPSIPPCAGATTTTTVPSTTTLPTTSLPGSTTTLVATSTTATTTSTTVTTTTTVIVTTSTSTTTTTTSSTSVPSTTTTLPGDLTFATRSSHSGCFFEWHVRNPGGALSHGAPSTTQTCVDGDPSCDMDGVSDGVCTFAVGACLGANDPRLPLCQPGTIDAVNLQRPAPLAPADLVEQTNAATLVNALKGLGVKVEAQRTVLQDAAPTTQRNLCTAATGFLVPHAPGLIGKRTLLANANAGRLRQRRNRLTLVCAPNTAACGNGVVELGEQCDDGNTNACDGCSSTCRVETCGNGVVECGEQCDDGQANGTPGAACTAACTLAPPALRIPGGGSAPGDCQLEYSLALGTAAIDKKGIPSYKQQCLDNDPTCDFDPTPGNCRLHLWACGGGADPRLACPANTVASVRLTKPTSGPLASSIATALAGLPLPVGPGETCTREVDVNVPLGRKQTVLQTQSRDGAGILDRDQLKLGCVAATRRHRSP